MIMVILVEINIVRRETRKNMKTDWKKCNAFKQTKQPKDTGQLSNCVDSEGSAKCNQCKLITKSTI
jgi:hypothetical protein